MGLGGLGGSAQMLFGGSGGQDLFQKITWVLVALFMVGSLVLAIMKSTGARSLGYVRPVQRERELKPRALPTRPAPKTAEAENAQTPVATLAQNTTSAPQATPTATELPASAPVQ